ncbi:hypothetical protein NL676_017952 [Syzygium grande]|nr:hypothetical protein NL676_017952 [Syzygium grande]
MGGSDKSFPASAMAVFDGGPSAGDPLSGERRRLRPRCCSYSAILRRVVAVVPFRFRCPRGGGERAEPALRVGFLGGRRKMNAGAVGNGCEIGGMEREYMRRHHRHEVAENQCSSALVKHIRAPVPLVWSLVRRFDQPQKYKPFVSRCIVRGNLEIGSLREVDVKSGLPATTSTERLELLDDDEHILSIRLKYTN